MRGIVGGVCCVVIGLLVSLVVVPNDTTLKATTVYDTEQYTSVVGESKSLLLSPFRRVPIPLEDSCLLLNNTHSIDPYIHDTYTGGGSGNATLDNNNITQTRRGCTPFITAPDGYWHVPDTSSLDYASAARFIEPTCTRATHTSKYTRERLLELFHGKNVLFYGHSHLRDHVLQILKHMNVSLSGTNSTAGPHKHSSWSRNITSPEGLWFHITVIFVGLNPTNVTFPVPYDITYDIAYVAIGAWQLTFGDMGYGVSLHRLRRAFYIFLSQFGKRARQIVMYNLHYMHAHCDPSHKYHQSLRTCLHYKRQDTFRKMILCAALKVLPRNRTWLWDVMSMTRSTYARLNTLPDRNHYIQNSRLMLEMLQVWADGTEALLLPRQGASSWPTLYDIGVRDRVCSPESYPCHVLCWCNRMSILHEKKIEDICRNFYKKINHGHPNATYVCPNPNTKLTTVHMFMTGKRKPKK